LYEAENYRNRLFPFFAIDPREKIKEQVKFLEKNIRENKIFGLKLHTLATNSSAQKLDETDFVDLLENLIYL
jgi:predicted TIM-barrel fold metal-dependent hydrolase